MRANRAVLGVLFLTMSLVPGVQAEIRLWVTPQSGFQAMTDHVFDPDALNFRPPFQGCDSVWTLKGPSRNTCNVETTETYFVWGKFSNEPDQALLRELTVEARLLPPGSYAPHIVDSVVYRHVKPAPQAWIRWDNAAPIRFSPSEGHALADPNHGILNTPSTSQDSKDLYCASQRTFLLGAISVHLPEDYEGHLQIHFSGFALYPSGSPNPTYPALWVYYGPGENDYVVLPNPPGDWAEVAEFYKEGPGACCYADGDCTITSMSDCQQTCGSFLGMCTECDACNPNPPTGACCFDDGTCEITLQTGCGACGGTYAGHGTTCDPNPCQGPGACCFSNGECLIRSQAGCLAWAGVFQGADTLCDPNPCPVLTGACCLDDGSCERMSYPACSQAGAWFAGYDIDCSAAPCAGLPTGACCFSYGSCALLRQIDCSAAGGVYRGDGTVCDPNSCTEPGRWSWEQKSPPSSPPPRRAFAMAANDDGLIVLFGGRGEDAQQDDIWFDDTWVWDGNTWTFQDIPGHPSARYEAAMGAISPFGAVLLFGGFDPSTYPHTFLDEAWIWWNPGSPAWVHLPMSSPWPSPRAGHAMAHDGAHHVFLYGGVYADWLTDLWQFDGATNEWTRLDDYGPPVAHPGLVYDTERDRLVLYGSYYDGAHFCGTWEWTGSAWQLIGSLESGCEDGEFAMAYHREAQRVVRQGGWGSAHETWSWDSSAWDDVLWGEPWSRTGHGMAQDYYMDAVVLFGGWETNQQSLDSDTWALTFDTVCHQSDPFWTLQPQPVTACAGERVTLSAAANGSPPHTYIWQVYFDGIWHDLASSAYQPAYTFIIYESQADWLWRCTVQACGARHYSQQTQISVLTGATILLDPVPVTVCAGEPVSFSITAAGDGPLEYYWQRSSNGSHWAYVVGATEPVCNFVAQAEDDGFQYRCKVTSPCATRYSDDALLTVGAGPTITQQPADQLIDIGQTAHFTVQDAGLGPVTHHWRKNGLELVDGGRISGATTAALTIATVHGSDQGAYDVVLVDSCGSTVSAAAVLSFTGPDCNDNGVPDAAEPDCNGNAIPDDCDIAAGTSPDCNANLAPDECDLAAGTSQDCQPNGVPDECDITAGTSRDCDLSGVPDECYLLYGDMDCSGSVDFDDVDPFVVAITDRLTYEAAFPSCSWFNGDADHDCDVDFDDVNSFVDLLPERAGR